MSAGASAAPSERRTDPRSGIIYEKVADRGSVFTIRAVGQRIAEGNRTVSYGTWLTWERA